MILSRFLDTDGDGTGTKNAIGNYSDAGLGETSFYIQPPAGRIYLITRLLVHIYDAGTFDIDAYGNNITLTNGISIRTSNNSATITELTDSVPIVHNADWAKFCYDFVVSDFGVVNEMGHARWTFTKSGAPIRLDGDESEKLEVVLNDDLSGLIEHYFLVQGTDNEKASKKEIANR